MKQKPFSREGFPWKREVISEDKRFSGKKFLQSLPRLRSRGDGRVMEQKCPCMYYTIKWKVGSFCLDSPFAMLRAPTVAFPQNSVAMHVWWH